MFKNHDVRFCRLHLKNILEFCDILFTTAFFNKLWACGSYITVLLRNISGLGPRAASYELKVDVIKLYRANKFNNELYIYAPETTTLSLLLFSQRAF